MNRLTPLYSAILLTLCATPVFAAQVDFTVSFNDPNQTYKSYYDEIRATTIAAGEEWANDLITTTPSTLNVQISFSSSNTVKTLEAASITSVPIADNSSPIPTYEQSAAYTIRTGEHPDGTPPDITITVGTDFLTNQLWFDPDPTKRSATVPNNKADASSYFLHEFSHAFAFEGFGDEKTGTLPSDKQSTFDQNVKAIDGHLYFIGSTAEAVYGGPVPLTDHNYTHVGNAAPGPGSDLLPDLLNGVEFYSGTRYYISPLDLAIVTDTGLPTKAFSTVPEPEQVWGTGIVALGLASSLIKRKRLCGKN